MRWVVNYIVILAIYAIYQVSARSNGVKRHKVCDDVPMKTLKIKEDPDSCGKFIACIGQFAEHYKCFSDAVYGNGTIECLACHEEEHLFTLGEDATTTTRRKIIVKDSKPTKAPNRKGNRKTLRPKVRKEMNPIEPEYEPNENENEYDELNPKYENDDDEKEASSDLAKTTVSQQQDRSSKSVTETNSNDESTEALRKSTENENTETSSGTSKIIPSSTEKVGSNSKNFETTKSTIDDLEPSTKIEEQENSNEVTTKILTKSTQTENKIPKAEAPETTSEISKVTSTNFVTTLEPEVIDSSSRASTSENLKSTESSHQPTLSSEKEYTEIISTEEPEIEQTDYDENNYEVQNPGVEKTTSENLIKTSLSTINSEKISSTRHALETSAPIESTHHPSSIPRTTTEKLENIPTEELVEEEINYDYEDQNAEFESTTTSILTSVSEKISSTQHALETSKSIESTHHPSSISGTAIEELENIPTEEFVEEEINYVDEEQNAEFENSTTTSISTTISEIITTQPTESTHNPSTNPEITTEKLESHPPEESTEEETDNEYEVQDSGYEYEDNEQTTNNLITSTVISTEHTKSISENNLDLISSTTTENIQNVTSQLSTTEIAQTLENLHHKSKPEIISNQPSNETLSPHKTNPTTLNEYELQTSTEISTSDPTLNYTEDKTEPDDIEENNFSTNFEEDTTSSEETSELSNFPNSTENSLLYSSENITNSSENAEYPETSDENTIETEYIDTTTESTIFPGHHPMHETTQNFTERENPSSIVDSTTLFQTSSFEPPQTSEGTINENTTSATIYESAESTSYSSIEHDESSPSQFSPTESITEETASDEYHEEIFSSVDEIESTSSEESFVEQTTEYDEETFQTCFHFPEYREEPEVGPEQKYTPPIIRFHKAHSETTESLLYDASTNNLNETTLDLLNQESTSQHQIVTEPPQNGGYDDEIGGILSESGYEEHTFKIRSLPPDHFHPTTDNSIRSTTDDGPHFIDNDEHFVQAIEYEDLSLRDIELIETSTTEVEINSDDAIYDTLDGRNFNDNEDKSTESTKMHIFHTLDVHTNEHQISTENSHDESGHNNSENIQSSTVYMTENMVDRDEGNLNANSTIFPNNVSDESNFDNNDGSEISSSTQSHVTSQSIDNSSVDNNADESSSTNQHGNSRKTTRFLKRRKIKKSRAVTTTTPLTTVM